MTDLYEPYEKLIRIVILGRVFEVPENNVLLRQMQFVAPDIGSGKYCWNAECRYCEIDYQRAAGDGHPPWPAGSRPAGMRVTKAGRDPLQHERGLAPPKAAE
jgi:hypothetical protein